MKKSLIALASLCLASASFAEGQAWNQHQGRYVELTAGSTFNYIGVFDSHARLGASAFQGTSIGLTYGYMYTPHYGFEGGLLSVFLNSELSNSLYAPYASMRFNMPLDDHFSILGKLGLMVPFVPNGGGVILPFTGIGASYATTKNVDLSLEYQGAVYGIAGAGTLGLGLTYHF